MYGIFFGHYMPCLIEGGNGGGGGRALVLHAQLAWLRGRAGPPSRKGGSSCLMLEQGMAIIIRHMHCCHASKQYDESKIHVSGT